MSQFSFWRIVEIGLDYSNHNFQLQQQQGNIALIHIKTNDKAEEIINDCVIFSLLCFYDVFCRSKMPHYLFGEGRK